MARRHVIQYFLEVENQYLEMVDNIKDLTEMFSENKISKEDYEAAIAEINIIKTNYERIGYIMFLLNKPNRKNKRLTDKEISWYKELKTASKEAIIDENNDALCTLKSMLNKKDIKGNNNNAQ